MRKQTKLLLASVLLAVSTANAVGPKIPWLLKFTPSDSIGVTGYWLYWRSPAGSYNDEQRVSMSVNAYQGFDLRTLGLPKGVYFVSASATNEMTESELSVETKWSFQNPNKPTELIILPAP